MLEDCRGLAVIGQARTMPLCVHALLSLRNAFAGRALHRQHWLGDARRKLQLLIGSCSVGAVRDVKSCGTAAVQHQTLPLRRFAVRRAIKSLLAAFHTYADIRDRHDIFAAIVAAKS